MDAQLDALIVASNYFYATTYLPITFGTLVWLYREDRRLPALARTPWAS